MFHCNKIYTEFPNDKFDTILSRTTISSTVKRMLFAGRTSLGSIFISFMYYPQRANDTNVCHITHLCKIHLLQQNNNDRTTAC